MKKQLFILSALCALLTACENYTSTQPGQPAPGSRGTTTDTTGRATRDQSGAINQPGHAAPDMNRNPREQGR